LCPDYWEQVMLGFAKFQRRLVMQHCHD
jgi:hypothetical protein